GLPYLEGGEIRAAALVDQGRGEPFRRAGKRIELRHRAGRRDRKLGFADRERRPFEISQIDQSLQIGLGFGEQPGPAREPSIACRPNGQLSPCPGMGDFDDGVLQIRYKRVIKEMHLSRRILAILSPTLAWVGLVFEVRRWLVSSHRNSVP